MERTFDNVKITSSFEVPETRNNLVSGETIGKHFGNIAKNIEVLGEHIDNQTIHAKVWKGTQEEYNAIESKEDNTIYIIKDSDNTLADKLIDDTSITATNKTWSVKKINESIPTSLPANGGNADTLGGISASELKRVAGAVVGGASAGVQWAGVDCQKGDIHLRMQVDADYDRILLFKSTDDGAGWEEIPLGNADTLDGLHESSFAQNIGVWNEGDIKNLLLNCTKSGFVFIHPGVTGMPSDNMYWFGLIDCNTVHRQLIIRNVTNNASYSIIWNHGTQGWTVWNNLADGGNATSIGAYTEEKIAALEARITALEAKG